MPLGRLTMMRRSSNRNKVQNKAPIPAEEVLAAELVGPTSTAISSTSMQSMKVRPLENKPGGKPSIVRSRQCIVNARFVGSSDSHRAILEAIFSASISLAR